MEFKYLSKLRPVTCIRFSLSFDLEAERSTDLLSAGSLPKCLRWWGLARLKPEARNSVWVCVWMVASQVLASPAASQGVCDWKARIGRWTETESRHPDPWCYCPTWCLSHYAEWPPSPPVDCIFLTLFIYLFILWEMRLFLEHSGECLLIATTWLPGRGQLIQKGNQP